VGLPLGLAGCRWWTGRPWSGTSRCWVASRRAASRTMVTLFHHSFPKWGPRDRRLAATRTPITLFAQFARYLPGPAHGLPCADLIIAL